MAARRWGEISYRRIPFKRMHINSLSKNFFKHDSQRFDAYLKSVAEFKVQISGATLLPHELVAKAVAPTAFEQTRPAESSAPTRFRTRIARREAQVVEAQWNTMFARLAN